jgi:hypothetical protein
MADLSLLQKDVSDIDRIEIYPYRDIPEEDWPSRGNAKGEMVKYSEEYRDIGFVCNYPTVARLDKLASLNGGVEFTEKKMKLGTRNTDELITYITANLILDVRGIEENGQPVPYEKVKKLIRKLFENNRFILQGFYNNYKDSGGAIIEKDEEDREDFLTESEDSSIPEHKPSGQAPLVEDKQEQHTSK